MGTPFHTTGSRIMKSLLYRCQGNSSVEHIECTNRQRKAGWLRYHEDRHSPQSAPWDAYMSSNSATRPDGQVINRTQLCLVNAREIRALDPIQGYTIFQKSISVRYTLNFETRPPFHISIGIRQRKSLGPKAMLVRLFNGLGGSSDRRKRTGTPTRIHPFELLGLERGERFLEVKGAQSRKCKRN